MDLFKELLPNLLEGKEPILEDEKEYVPYVINKALSAHLDIILYVQEMNMNYDLDRKLQYDYLFYSIRKKKRPFNKWLKPEVNEEIKACMEYFGYSPQKAQGIINILSKNQLKEIMDKLKSKEQMKK